MKPQLEIRNVHPVNFLCIDWDKHLDKIASLTNESVLNKVCHRYGVTPEQVLGKDRSADIITARHSYRFILKHLFNYSLKQVARYTNRPEHSTVIHSLQVTKNLCQAYKDKFTEIYDLCYCIDKRLAVRLNEIIFENKYEKVFKIK
jgi:hypothetical protein